MSRGVYGIAADLLDPPEPEDVQMSAEAAEMAVSLSSFVRHAWRVLEPGTHYLHNWHIDLIAEYLELFYVRKLRRVIFNVPPRFMKSSLVTIMGPVWDWIYRPTDRFMFASYAQELAYKHSVDRRTLIRSPWFQEHYGHIFSLARDQDEKREFSNSRRGHMIATSMLGQATGKGGDFIVVDDPQNPEKARSDTLRERINSAFDSTFMQRLDDPKTGGIAIVMQRLHSRDLTGHVIEKELELGDGDGDRWVQVRIPAEAPVRTTVTFPKSRTVIVREPGDILWDERMGARELTQKKTDLGALMYAGQYGQEPTDEQGGIFPRTHWRFWKPAGSDLPQVRIETGGGTSHSVDAVDLPTLEERIQSWDMAFKDKKDSDYVVGGVLGRERGRYFLLDRVRDRMSFTATVKEFRRFSELHPSATLKLVEDKANGTAVMDTLRDEVVGIVGVEPQGGKEARAWAVQPVIESGNVYLPHPVIAPWVWDFIEECAAFPNGSHDDQVDMLTQGLLRLLRRGKPASIESPADYSF